MSTTFLKKRINRLAFSHIRADGFTSFENKLFTEWKMPFDRKVDELIAQHPLLKYVSWLLIPFYAVNKKWRIGLLLIILGLFSYLSTNLVLEALLKFILLSSFGLLFITFSIKAYQLLLRSLTKRYHSFKQELNRMINHVIQLVNQNSYLNTYYIAEGKENPDWFHIYLYTTTEYGVDEIDISYLESVFQKKVHQFANHREYIYFQIHITSPDHKTSHSWEANGMAEQMPTIELSEAERNKQIKEALDELDEMVGLQPVKDYVHELHDWVTLQKERSKVGQSVSKQSMHMIFTGNPGTGKTTVARVVAKTLHALGVVSKGHLVEVTRDRLVAEYIGQTAPKTKKVIEQAVGGVLFIDEAYALARGGDNDFGKEAIDTLVKGMEEYRSDLVVILAGYTGEMNEFLKANSGLKSRFPNQIEFPDYTPEELLQLAYHQLKQEQLRLGEGAEQALLQVLKRKQIAGRNDDGNGRLVRNLIQEAVRRQSTRLKQLKKYSPEELTLLRVEDFSAEVGEDKKPFELEEAFARIVGNEEVKQHIRSLVAQIRIQKMREEQGLSSGFSQSLHMVFKGNPGTGKTTFARILAQVMREEGILKSGQLIETDRSGLVANYIGQTATKVNEVIKEALGGILFIDEAYALIPKGEGDFGREAIDTLVKGMEDHRENLIVILAGYDQDMEQFFTVNPGLASRFPHVFHFQNYTKEELFQILVIQATEQNYHVEENCHETLFPILAQEAMNPNSSNGRFVRNLFEQAVRNQAVRLQKIGALEKSDLMLLKAEDFTPRSS